MSARLRFACSGFDEGGVWRWAEPEEHLWCIWLCLSGAWRAITTPLKLDESHTPPPTHNKHSLSLSLSCSLSSFLFLALTPSIHLGNTAHFFEPHCLISWPTTLPSENTEGTSKHGFVFYHCNLFYSFTMSCLETILRIAQSFVFWNDRRREKLTISFVFPITSQVFWGIKLMGAGNNLGYDEASVRQQTDKEESKVLSRLLKKWPSFYIQLNSCSYWAKHTQESQYICI